MVKIGAIIGAVFTTIGGIFLNIAIGYTMNNDLSWENYRDSISFTSGSTSPLGVIWTILFYLGLIIVLASGFIKGKLFLKVGGGIMIIALGLIMTSWFTGALFESLYNIGGIILFIGILVYFIGCIQFRKHNIVTIFTGFLLFISITFSQIVAGTIMLVITDGSNTWRMIHLVSLTFQIAVFILHSWIFGFSKKKIQYSDEVEDTLSIEKGQAFASYVPSEMKKKKKGKKPSEDDEISFTF
ncbi:hypothetical protein DSAG12_03388 [Promethearchaeum syntrophicum]|uniref:DUF998 domain-containing protein n=1 Tax=Promethearchaeum syntrophicum TaxID=2594042 RepID=A0A5B9DEW4_9ARCH|nr:hypothetical protein [Candidatus Prometheoarchaeum syntrophicum]QEE17551.1 hypothetical protein DSAG12_03388 [Candidatus Prometheoarchaeum syntrophicum]